jgi:hypothetical protein
MKAKTKIEQIYIIKNIWNVYKEIIEIVKRIEVLNDHKNLEFICKEENYPKISSEFDTLNLVTHQAMKVEWDKSKKMF